MSRRRRLWPMMVLVLMFFGAFRLLGEPVVSTPDLLMAAPPETSFTVLCYHRFVVHSDEKAGSTQAEYQLPMDEFKWQMQYLKDNGFTPISMQQLLDYWFQGKPLPLKPVLISFDDGFRTIYRDAFPTIREFKYPTVLFLYTKFIEYGEAALKRSKMIKVKSRKNVKRSIEALRDSDIVEMQKEGMDVQSHTAHHLNLGLEEEKRTAEDFKDLLNLELTEPVTYIKEKFGIRPRVIAYPYGVYNPDILKKTKEVGYELAFTVNPGPNDRTVDPLKLRRNLILCPITHKNFEGFFKSKVLHLEKVKPEDGQFIESDKPVVSALIKDDIDPASIHFKLGDKLIPFKYDAATHKIRHWVKGSLKGGGHMLTLAAKDRAGQRRVYTWYFRVKHKDFETKATEE